MIKKIQNSELHKKRLISGMIAEIDSLKTNLINRIDEIQDDDFAKLYEFVSTKKAAEIIGVSMPTLKKYTEEGILKKYQLGHKTYYLREELVMAIKI